MSRIVVFGGGGFIGSAIRASIDAAVAPTRAEADLADAQSLRRLLRPGDRVINAAGYAIATDRSEDGRARLRRDGRAAGDEPVRFGDCELDLARAELRRAGSVVATTPLELKILGFFTQRPGRVLTRRVLIDEVWGRDTAITERVVDNQIVHLRRKIEPSPDAPRFLKSVRGIGYRFDPEDVTES